MGELITTMFSGFTDTVKGLGGGIKTMFTELLYQDPSAEVLVISDLAKFGFFVGGVSLALGLGYIGLRLIRRQL